MDQERTGEFLSQLRDSAYIVQNITQKVRDFLIKQRQ